MFQDLVIQKLEGRKSEGQANLEGRKIRRYEGKLFSVNSLSSNPPTLLSSNNQPLTLARKGCKKSASPFTLHSSLKKRTAFTLAEVLITLGIIGIVAALTLPSIVSNYKKQSIEKKLAKYYSVMNQAITQSEQENGEFSTWDFTLDSHDFYDRYLAKYLKTIKVHKNNDKRFLKIVFADGTMASMGYTRCINFYPKVTKNAFYEGVQPACSNFPIENDTSGKYGKEQFEFWLCQNFYQTNFISTKKFEPYGVKGCSSNKYIDEQTLYDDCTNPESGRYCTEIIRRNGWKIPDNYPIRI